MSNRPLHLIRQSAINNIKSNEALFWNELKRCQITPDEAFDFLGEEYWDESPFSFDFTFAMDGYKKPEKSDFENTVRLYKALKDVPKNVLFSETFLFSFLMDFGYAYLQWRWLPVYKDDPHRGLTHLLFMTNPRRAISVNTLGHLLFRAFMLVDENETGAKKYDLLKQAYKCGNCFTLDYYSYADNQKVYKSFVSFMVQAQQKGSPLTNMQTKKMCAHLSMLQGVSTLEALEESEIVSLLSDYWESLRADDQ